MHPASLSADTPRRPSIHSAFMSDGLIPFSDLSGYAVAGIFAVYFLSFFIRGTLGFGSGMPAILGSVWVMPPHDAVLIALLTSVFAQVQLLPQGMKEANWRITKPMMAGTIISVVVGVWIFAILKAAWLTIVLGACLSVAVLIDVAGLADRAALHMRLDRASIAFGLATIAGLSFYLRWATPQPRTFRATNIVLSGFMVLWRAIVTLFAGLITLKLVIESALVMPAVYAGGWAGRRFAMKLSAKRYFGAFRILLLVASVALIWKGIAALHR
jgi:uncharacterized membrane protein YfcA